MKKFIPYIVIIVLISVIYWVFITPAIKTDVAKYEDLIYQLEKKVDSLHSKNDLLENEADSLELKLEEYDEKIVKLNLHSQQISKHVAILAKNRNIRKIINTFQKKLIKKNKKICIEGRDIASKILAKNPKYDLAFYFKCNLSVSSYRRWLDLKKTVPLKEVKKSLKNRTKMDKTRKNSPLVKVKDAILIRTDKLSKRGVLNKMSKYIENLN